MNDLLNLRAITQIVVMVSVFALIVNLGYEWIRPAHLIAGFTWWGMVFFINFILLPVFPRFQPSTQMELLGNVFPRIFRFATVFGFFTVSLGWYFAMEFYTGWRFAYFFRTTENTLFLVGISMVTFLYCFHLFLERHEIQLISDIANGRIEYEDNQVQTLIKYLNRLPRVGFGIMTFAVIMMFVH